MLFQVDSSPGWVFDPFFPPIFSSPLGPTVRLGCYALLFGLGMLGDGLAWQKLGPAGSGLCSRQVSLPLDST